MKKIGFLGAYDKTDFILYVAKALTVLGKKVLFIDATSTQKARYVVPVINPTKAYVSEYEGIDVSVGFDNYDEIKKFLNRSQEQEFDYDVALIDVDNVWNYQKLNVQESEKKYFVTSFDLYSLKKGLELINDLPVPTKMTKVIFSKDMLKEDDEYLNYLSLGSKAIWNEEYRVYLPLDNGDQSVIIENQRVAKIGIRKLSVHYKESLCYIVQDIADDVKEQEVRKAFKFLEKDV